MTEEVASVVDELRKRIDVEDKATRVSTDKVDALKKEVMVDIFWRK